MNNRVIQVEVSTRCNLKCIMCPHTIFKDQWISRDMDLTLFKRILSSVEEDTYLHLQGWGEPLVNPRIFDMIKLACEKGCKVGLTTNGYYLEDKVISKITGSLDLIAISYAGKYGVHESIRRGGQFNILFDATKKLIDFKINSGYDTPKVVITILMMKNNIKYLPSLIKELSIVGVDEIIVTNLDYVPNKTLYELRVFSFGEVKKEYMNILKKCGEIAWEYGINFVARPLECREQAICMENPLDNLFVTVDGYISPCVYLHLPTDQNHIPRFFEGREYRVNKVYFGNILVKDLPDIWEEPEYRRFRRIFNDRLSSEKLSMLMPGFDTYEEEFKYAPRLPNSCMTCYKAYGV